MNWILDADIAGFFDTLSHDWLIRFVEHRIGDRRVIRLIRKWLKAGVMEDGVVAATTAGTPQGAVASPLLANIYLHYVFDRWAQRWRKRHAQGDIIIVRYADDIVVGFEHEAEARRFLADLRQRLEEFALSLHPDKTRLIEFARHAAVNRRRRGVGKPPDSLRDALCATFVGDWEEPSGESRLKCLVEMSVFTHSRSRRARICARERFKFPQPSRHGSWS